MRNETDHTYDDIIHLPHHVSAVHPHMPAADRAAQFSPFAALTGHGAAIRETARLTQEQRELEEDAREALDQKLQTLRRRQSENPQITVRCFQPDARKKGGAYVTVSGKLKKIDGDRRLVIFTDRTEIPIDRITEIEE